MTDRSGWSPERRARFNATLARKRAEGRSGWSPERRARMATVVGAVDRLDAVEVDMATLGRELEAIRRSIADHLGSHQAIVEWRPDHRRHKDGGTPVRAQRRAVGVPRRPPKLVKSGPAPKRRLRAP